MEAPSKIETNPLVRTKWEVTQKSMRWLTERSRVVEGSTKSKWDLLDWQSFLENKIMSSAIEGKSVVSVDFTWDGCADVVRTALIEHMTSMGFKVDWQEKRLWIEW